MSRSFTTYSFKPDFIQRYKAYISSKEYRHQSDHAKSEYWNYYSKKIGVEIKDDKLITYGESGYYTPGSSSTIKKVLGKLKNPSQLKSAIARRVFHQPSLMRLPSFFEAFDLVMNENELSDPRRSKRHINFKEIKKNSNAYQTTDDVKSRYFAKAKYSVSHLIVHTAYFFNIISSHCQLDKSKVVMEIGAGNGNVLSFLKHHYPHLTLISIDLPETLSHSIPFIYDLFPEAKICFPHEEIKGKHTDYDFIFLTTTQTDKIPNNSVDLSINTCSFQEMLPAQIAEYFSLIERVSSNGAHFFTSNRVEKTPVADLVEFREKDEPTIRFAEYPWNAKNQTLIYEICRLSRLVQLDDCYLRLEKILK